MIELAKEHNIRVIVDGTNLDDLGEYRPGIEALKQNGIRSPLVETNFSKSEIRESESCLNVISENLNTTFRSIDTKNVLSTPSRKAF